MPLHINMYAKCTCSEWNFESDESDVNVCIFVNVLVHNLDSVSIQTHTIFCGWSFYVQIFILVKSLSKQLPLHFFMWKKLYSTSTDLSLCMTWDGVLYFFFWCDWRWWAWTEKKVATALLSFKKKKKKSCKIARKEGKSYVIIGRLTDQCWWHIDWKCWLYTSSHLGWQRCHSGSC